MITYPTENRMTHSATAATNRRSSLTCGERKLWLRLPALRMLGSFALCTGLLASCVSELPVDEPTAGQPIEGERIVISGALPGGLAANSRAESNAVKPIPTIAGECNADMLRVWVYRQDAILASLSIDNLGQVLDITKKIEYYSGSGNRDRATYYHYSGAYPVSGTLPSLFAVPSLAYTDEDKDFFSVTGTEKYKGLTFTLQNAAGNYHVPELYFGRLIFDNKGSRHEGLSSEGTFIRNVALAGANYNDCALSGTLYRVVSQLNLKVTNVNVEEVKRMELYVENLPVRISLFGNHGEWYKVGAASGDSDFMSGYTLVDSTDDFTGGTAHLSTFMLPADRGQRLRVRIWYKEDEEGQGESEGQEPFTDHDIRAARSVSMTGDDVGVYDSEKESLTIYDGNDYTFHSYSNVRVNLSGKFEEVFAEHIEVEVNLEVCPSFDGVHEFTIN